jgi:ATP:cob(I)alamin adenosyltransferase
MFTRKGDDGTTSIGNNRVGKDSIIVNILGEIDELNSFLGYTLTKIEWDDIRNDLMRVQEHLFILGEDIIKSNNKIGENEIKWLEERVIKYRSESGPVKLFVIPGGSEIASLLHITRTITRRVERELVKYSKENTFNKWCLVYINRLSSLLFIMAVVANKRKGIQERIYDIGKYF